MAEELQYSSRPDYKRKYEDQTTPPPPPSSIPRRSTGFSAPIVSQSSDLTQPPPSYNNVPPPLDEIQLAKQKAQEIAARLFSNAEAKRPRVENGGAIDDSSNDFTHKPLGQQIPSSQQVGMSPPPPPSSALPIPYGFQGSSKKIDIPNGRVGVIIGKAGETIKYLQVQSGAKIQVTRDMDADRNSETRAVELVGNPEQISKAEQLIKDVIAEAEAGGSGTVARRFVAQPGAEQYTMKVPNNKVGLIIGKGGETIKNMQLRSGARIQLIPLHLPPGDTSMERNLYIDGSQEQIEAAKQLVNEVISENRVRNSSMGGGYSQQGYRAPSWGPPAPPQMQQPGYGYMQPGAYPGPAPQYNSSSQPPYSGYPPQPTSTGAPSGWDQTTALPSQQTTQGTGYDYYNQASSQQQAHGGPSTTTDTSGYNYSQAPASNYNQPQVSYGESNYSQPPNGQQGYSDGYGGGYPASTAQPGYGSQANLQTGYDQQQGYNSVPPYGTSVNPSQDGVAPSYGAQGGPTQVPPTQQVTPPVQPPAATQQGFASQPLNTAPTSYPQGPAQSGYGIPPTSQPGYGGQLPAQTGYGQSPVVAQPGYGPSQGQKLPPSQGYPHSLPPSTQSGYAQPESGPYRPSPSGYGSVGQPGYGQQPYSAAPASQPGYGQVPQIHSGYSQASVYSKDNGGAGGTVAPSGSQPVQPSGVAKASPPS